MMRWDSWWHVLYRLNSRLGIPDSLKKLELLNSPNLGAIANMVCIYIYVYSTLFIYIYINRKRRGISLNKGCSFFQVWQRNWSHPQAEQCQRSSQSLGIPNKKHLLGMAIILNPTDVSYWILDTPSPTDGYYYNPTVIIRVFLLQLSIILLLSYINLHSMMKYPTMYHCYWGYHIIYTHV